jgi:hypothetical protein
MELGLLPRLKKLEYSETDDAGDAFATFVTACQNSGRPMTLIHHSSNLVWKES